MNIRTEILKLVKDQINPSVYSGKVVSVDLDAMTCEIDLQSMPNIYDVRLRASIDSVVSGLLIAPKVGSIVLVCRIDGRIESSFVVAFSEIQSIRILTTDPIELQGDNLGGLVISDKVATEINEIKTELNELKTLLASWVPIPQDGGASLKTIMAQYAASPMPATQSSDLQNKKVKHGN